MERNNMKHNHTHIVVVLDRSGSMATVADDTINGFNRFLDDQKSAPGTANITLNQFDNEFEVVIDNKDIKSAEHLTSKTFVPRGNTALLDAIGRSITTTGSKIESMPEHERPSRVVMVVVTDGQENASHEFKQEKVFEMIEHQRTKYSWEFVFMGADQQAIKNASGMGFAASNAMNYAKSSTGTRMAFASAASNLRKMRSGDKADMSFTTADLQAQAQAGVAEQK